MSAALLVHQAYYGAVNGISHGQLATSLPDADLRAFLVAFTDRPGVVPAGVALPPYLTATSHGSYFLISRTWADSAVARPGMVFTHVLMLPLAAAAAESDLASLLQLFVPQPPPVAEREEKLAPLVLSIRPAESGAHPAAEVQDAWLTVGCQIVEQTTNTPVFVTGQPADFEELLQSLWRGLPVPLRFTVSWGIRFTPPPFREPLPRLVYVPADLAERWRGHELLPLNPAALRRPESVLEQYLFGGEEQQAFRLFIADLGTDFDSYRTLRLGQQVYNLVRRLRQKAVGPDELLLLLRALNSLQPDPDQGHSLKEQAVDALAQHLAEAATPSALALALRNLPLNPFPTGLARLKPLVEQKVVELVLTDPTDARAHTVLLDQLVETDITRQQPWWQQAAGAALTRALRLATPAAARVIWQGLVRSDATRTYLQRVVPSTSEWEQQLQLIVPAQVAPAIADSVVLFATGRHWWELTATVLAAAYAPIEALKRQWQIEKPLGIRESLRLDRLAAPVSDLELVTLALREPSWQLQELAGERAGLTPEILAALDVREPAWRVIWEVSLRHTRSLEAGVPQPAKIVETLLGELVSGRADGAALLGLLEWVAASPFANVLALPSRSRLWERLPDAVQPRFLQATLDALVAAILDGTWAVAVDPALLTAGQGHVFNARFLHRYRRDPAAVLSVNAVLGNLHEEALRDYLAQLPGPESVVAQQLGKLIATRRWTLAARALLERTRFEPAFVPALHECADLLSFWEKLPHHHLFRWLPAKQDGWLVLEDLMRQLCERGPDQYGIWRRAGGALAELPLSDSPAAQWAAAIRLLRKGGGGAITVKSLLLAAQAQFPHNEKLRAMVEAPHLFAVR